MRNITALLGLVLLAAAPAPRDWTRVTTPTPAGAYISGNPAARVKLVEYASYTCPHCAAFVTESAPVLKDQMIRSGSTSLEYRHLVRDGLDLAAAILARCGGAGRFAGTSSLIFRTQDQWLTRGIEYQQANGERIALYPRLGQLRALADGAGLTQLVEAQGLAPAAVDRCFANTTGVDRVLRMTSAAPPSVTGTPTFFINGKPAPPVGWVDLQPLLRAAGAH